MLIRNKHCEQFDSFIESVQILPCPQLGKFIKKSYIWDPTTKQATRPLAMFDNNNKTLNDANLSDARLCDANFRDARFDVMLDNSQNIHYYTHDANKNVTELISDSGAISGHYEYSPFGATIASSGDLSYSNPFQFSSEFSDHPLGLIYYNYRHYNPLDGRWISRDPIEEQGGWNLYGMVKNNPNNFSDIKGLSSVCDKTMEGPAPYNETAIYNYAYEYPEETGPCILFIQSVKIRCVYQRRYISGFLVDDPYPHTFEDLEEIYPKSTWVVDETYSFVTTYRCCCPTLW